MSTTSKGTAYAKKVADMLRPLGLVKRKAWLAAGDDMTLTVTPTLELSVEAKDHRTYSLSTWIDQARRQAPEGHHPVVFFHRNGKASAEDGFVLMTGADFVRLITALKEQP